MEPISFTPELIVGIVGALLSLVFSYFPAVSTWYSALKTEAKSGIMLGLLVLSSVTVYLLVLYGVLPATEPITWQMLVRVLFAAIVANQSTYLLSPQKK
jgi:uncharacterized protein with PQ loop repeat